MKPYQSLDRQPTNLLPERWRGWPCGKSEDDVQPIEWLVTVPGVHPGVHIKNRLCILKQLNCGVFCWDLHFYQRKLKTLGSSTSSKKIIHLNLASQTHRHKVDFLRRQGRLDLRFDWAWCVMCLVQFQWLCLTINQHSFDSWQLTLPPTMFQSTNWVATFVW